MTLLISTRHGTIHLPRTRLKTPGSTTSPRPSRPPLPSRPPSQQANTTISPLFRSNVHHTSSYYPLYRTTHPKLDLCAPMTAYVDDFFKLDPERARHRPKLSLCARRISLFERQQDQRSFAVRHFLRRIQEEGDRVEEGGKDGDVVRSVYDTFE